MNKKIKILSIFLLFVLLTFSTSIFGAVSVKANSSVNVGDNITVSINVSNVATWQLTVSCTGNLKLVSGSTALVRGDNGIDDVSTVAGTLVFKATGTGSGNIIVSGNSYTAAGTSANSSASKTISITTPVAPPKPVDPPPNNNTNNNTNNTNNKNNVKNNAFLRSLTVGIEGLTPGFNRNTLNYNLTVKENINDINVVARAEDSKASVYVYGNKNLVKGKNTITITVTAADRKTKKVYNIIVDKTNNPELSLATLANLTIEGYEFKEAYNKEKFEYELLDKIAFEVDKLTVIPSPDNTKAKVEIIGNEKLVAGENIITVKVTSEDGSTTKEYKIKVIKDEEKVVATVVETNALKNNDLTFFEKAYKFFKKNGLVLLLFTLVVVEFIEILILYFGWYVPKKIEIKKENDVAIFNKRRKINLDNTSEDIKSDELKEFEIKEKIKEDVIETVDEVDNIDLDNNEDNNI